MQTFIERGKTREECEAIVREKYGEHAKITEFRTVPAGGFFGFLRPDVTEAKGLVPEKPDMSKYALGIYKFPGAVQPAAPLNIENEKNKIMQTAAGMTGTDPSMQKVLVELKNLNEKIESKINVQNAEHESIVRLNELLEKNDFTRSYSSKIIDRVRSELSLDALDDFDGVCKKTLEWIAGDISIYNEAQPVKLPRIIVLVGPTGVGKTTTIAKLAVRFRQGDEDNKKYHAGFITIDNYRLGAHQQLEQYSEILKIPFATPNDETSLKNELSNQSESVDIILIDTAGKSPQDSIQLAETKEMLDICGSRAEVYLTFSASTKTADIIETMRQFEPFAYRAVIVTKLDETKRIGNVLSALAESGKSVLYITDGQTSTNKTIKKADAVELLKYLEM
ncbi:flagellar biosynthesis protein FlhF [Spirochaetia bacterium]|nr:flagellar biosynthesis protein FlhF [Spirochaetia bacterium]